MQVEPKYTITEDGVFLPGKADFILFEEDWDRFPSAVPVTLETTRNPTFVEYARDLKYMGIKNCLWPLSLLDPTIEGLDPHDEASLDLEQKAAIKREATYNPWYYLREILMIPPATGVDANLFRANRGNMSLIWSYCNHVDYLLIQPRQTGKSISSFALYSWLLYFRYTNTRIGLVTKSDELRAENARLLRAVKDFIPPYLVVNDRKDSMNDSMVTYNARGNRFVIAVSRSDESGAYKVGRGNTMPTAGWDEMPYIPHISIAYSAAMAAGDAVIIEAIKKGIPYGSIMTTTAGKQDDRDGSYVYEMWRNAARWTENFFDAKDRAGYVEMVTLNKKGRKILVQGTWNHIQMGISDRQHYDNIVKNNVSGDDASRDYFNNWTVGGLSSPLDLATLERITKSKMPVVWTETINKMLVNWFVSQAEVLKLKAIPLIIGADTSEGGGNDGLALTITHPYTGEVLGTSNMNEVLIPRYGDFLADLMLSYPKSIIIPERKSTGQTFIDTLIIRLHAAGHDPFKRIFNMIVQESRGNPSAYNDIRGGIVGRNDEFYSRRKKTFGFCTGTTTRRTLYTDILSIGSKKVADNIRDELLISEIVGLEKDSKGRVDHSESGHDDQVISWLLTLWMLVYGDNLDYYGIDQRRVLSSVIDSTQSIDEIYEQEEIEELNQRLEQTLDKLKNTRDQNLIARYERALNHIALELEDLGAEPINIQAKIDDMRATMRYRN